MVFKIILMLFPLALGGMILLLLVKRGGNTEGLLSNSPRKLRERWGTIVFLTFLFFIGYSFVQYTQSLEYASINLSFNYPRASSGLNPNGSRFNPSEILSQEVLEGAIKRGVFEDVTPEDLQKSLSLDMKVEGNIGSKEDYHISTEYVINYNATDETEHLKADSVVKMTAYTYYNYFVDEYSENNSILDLDFSGLRELDYLAKTDYLDVQALKLRQFMINCYNENASYQSPVTGETFSSIRNKIDTFRDVELERYNSYVLTYGLSKDSDEYIAKLNYDNKMYDIDYMKNYSAYQVRLSAIDMYASEMARIVLAPTYDEESQFYMSRTKIGVDYFADEAEKAMNEATALKHRIDTNEYNIEQLQSSKATVENYKAADLTLASLEQELKDLAGEAKDIAESYTRQKTSNYLTIVVNKKDLMSILEVKRGIVYSLVFCGMMCLYVLLRFADDESGKNKKSAKRSSALIETRAAMRR